MLTSEMNSVRHIKCDEAPGICNNCQSTGRKCDGYDLHRLPAKTERLAFTPYALSKLGWTTTSDERRCFAYFQRCSIPGLGALFESPLWSRIILQIGHADPAVYHAANMLGAVHEDSAANKMRLSGQDIKRARHRFAIQQSSRAYTYLSKRQTSNDPQFRQVMLVCCLLFVMSELLLGQYQNAFKHLHSGLHILKETQEHHQKIILDDSLIRVFERLDIESSHFGPGTPFLFTHGRIGDGLQISDVFSRMTNVADVHRSVTVLLNMGIPFLARCWPFSAAEIAVEYESLFQKQQEIMFLNYEFQSRFRIFYREYYTTLSLREQGCIDMLQIQSLGQILSLKTCLIKGPVPESLTPEYSTLLLAVQDFMAKFPDRPTFTLDYGILPTLWVVASQCPDYAIRLEAIRTVQIRPHCEGIVNSNVIVSMALNNLKVDLRIWVQPDSSIIDAETEEELFKFLSDTLKSSEQAKNWSFIRGRKIFRGILSG